MSKLCGCENGLTKKEIEQAVKELLGKEFQFTNSEGTVWKNGYKYAVASVLKLFEEE